jgi:hypothetical protein
MPAKTAKSSAFRQWVLSLVVGAVVTTAVAWLFAVVSEMIPGREMDAPYARGPVWPVSVPADWPPASDLQAVTVPGARRIIGGWNTNGKEPGGGLAVYQVGAPALALERWMISDSNHGSVYVDKWCIDRRLPLHPIWQGFAFNTFFYAGIAWILWQIPQALRRRGRRIAGQCVACGYDLQGLPSDAPCPECGGKRKETR